MAEKKSVGRPKKITGEVVRGSVVFSADTHSKLNRLARHTGLSVNELVNKIIEEYIKQKQPVLKILDDADREIAELENKIKGGDDDE